MKTVSAKLCSVLTEPAWAPVGCSKCRYDPERASHRIPASVRLALTVLLFALPVALYLWLISADGVDMLRADQWYDVNLIQSSLTGHLTFSMLWAVAVCPTGSAIRSRL